MSARFLFLNDPSRVMPLPDLVHIPAVGDLVRIEGRGFLVARTDWTVVQDPKRATWPCLDCDIVLDPEPG